MIWIHLLWMFISVHKVCGNCSPGSFLNSTSSCELCPKGFYQPSSGQNNCIRCDEFKTTIGTGAVLEAECSEDILGCDGGYCCLGASDVCPALGAVVGEPNCFCDISCIETADCCSDFETECFPCALGEYYDVVTSACQECPVGTYRNVSTLDCQTCSPATYTTLTNGSSSANDCIFICGGGEYIATNAAGNLVCEPCPEDTYKTADYNEATNCTACPEARPRNHITGSDTEADCQYAICGQGEQYNPNNFLECQTCAIGTFQDKTYPLDFDECQSCPTGQSTAQAGSTSSQCVDPCPDGQEYYSPTQQCEDCAINYYKDNSVSAQGAYTTCQQCPDAGFRTLGTGAASAADCSVVTCSPGSYTNVGSNQCILCGQDTYQNEEWQTACNDCPQGHGTLDGVTGANDISLCYEFCPDGEELDELLQCVSCAIGYYKNNTEGRFENCTICPDPDFITESTGSTSVSQCTITKCMAGSYRDTSTNTCVPCAKGSYQALDYQASCQPCPFGLTTETEGADEMAMCLSKTTHTFLVGMLTTLACSAYPGFKNSSSNIYLSVSQKAFVIVGNVIDSNVTSVNVVSQNVQFVGFRCFDDVINVLLEVDIESTEQDASIVEAALQTTLSTAMSSGTLSDPGGLAASLPVSPSGITDDDIASSSNLECPSGRYTNLTTLTCPQCLKGSFQPSDTPELCYPCALGLTTAGNGAFGLEGELCVITNPDDYILHPFLLEITTVTECAESFTDPTSSIYVAYANDVEVIVINIIMARVDQQYWLNTPIVQFVGFRCSSPVRILIEITLANLDATDAASVNAVLAALNTETADGLLSDPDNTVGVGDIPVSTTGAVMADTLSGNDLNCPSGQQTDIATGRCVNCSLGTYQPENVPELCYPCPNDTTTVSTGTVLPVGADLTRVCPITVTEAILIPEGVTVPDVNPGCPAFLYNGVCVTACPTGYIADNSQVCQVDEDYEKSENEGKTGASALGIGLSASFGGLSLTLFVIFIVCAWRQGSMTTRLKKRFGKPRFLDTVPQEHPYQDQDPDRHIPRSSNWAMSNHRGTAYNPYYRY